MNFHIDKHIGVIGVKIHWMHSDVGKDRWWCRQAIAIMGGFNMPLEYILKTSPFDPDFQDNYVEGKGATKEEALANMEKGMKEISDSLWLI